MAWTYGANPSVPLDRARLLIGDTEQTDPYLDDEVITYYVGLAGTPEGAAQTLSTLIIAKLAREVDYVIGPESVKASQRLQNYRLLLKDLRVLWVGINAAPSADVCNTPQFDIGMHDNAYQLNLLRGTREDV